MGVFVLCPKNVLLVHLRHKCSLYKKKDISNFPHIIYYRLPPVGQNSHHTNQMLPDVGLSIDCTDDHVSTLYQWNIYFQYFKRIYKNR